jgi:hypothetical protein
MVLRLESIVQSARRSNEEGQGGEGRASSRLERNEGGDSLDIGPVGVGGYERGDDMLGNDDYGSQETQPLLQGAPLLPAPRA